MKTAHHPGNRAVPTFRIRKLQQQNGINRGGFDAFQMLVPYDHPHRPVNVLAHITAWQTLIF